MYKIDLNKLTPDMVIHCDSEDQMRACVEQIGWNDKSSLVPHTNCLRLNSNKKIARHDSSLHYLSSGYVLTPFEDILDDNPSIIIPNVEFLKRYKDICNSNTCSECPFGTIPCLSSLDDPTTEDLENFISICKDVFSPQIDKSKIRPNMVIQCHTSQQAEQLYNLLNSQTALPITNLCFRIGSDGTIVESDSFSNYTHRSYEVTPIEELMKGNE